MGAGDREREREVPKTGFCLRMFNAALFRTAKKLETNYAADDGELAL